MQLNPLFLSEILQHAVVTGVRAGFAQAHEASRNPQLQGTPELITSVVTFNVLAQLSRVFDLPLLGEQLEAQPAQQLQQPQPQLPDVQPG